jgi:hypothetical protein
VITCQLMGTGRGLLAFHLHEHLRQDEFAKVSDKIDYSI